MAADYEKRAVGRMDSANGLGGSAPPEISTAWLVDKSPIRFDSLNFASDKPSPSTVRFLQVMGEMKGGLRKMVDVVRRERQERPFFTRSETQISAFPLAPGKSRVRIFRPSLAALRIVSFFTASPSSTLPPIVGSVVVRWAGGRAWAARATPDPPQSHHSLFRRFAKIISSILPTSCATISIHHLSYPQILLGSHL